MNQSRQILHEIDLSLRIVYRMLGELNCYQMQKKSNLTEFSTLTVWIGPFSFFLLLIFIQYFKRVMHQAAIASLSCGPLKV